MYKGWRSMMLEPALVVPVALLGATAKFHNQLHEQHPQGHSLRHCRPAGNNRPLLQ
jgi:hypothetical protein